MTADTPYYWLSRVAADDPARPCLVDDADVLTYGEVLERVDARAPAVRAGVDTWEITPVEVAIDVESIIEILAVQEAGGVPLPHTGGAPSLPVASAQDVAVCVETSGSRGPPKIVPLTYKSIESSVRASRERLGNDADDRWLLCLPLNHVGGLSIVWRSLEAGGAAIVAPFEASGGPIERHRPTIASMVPTMVHRLLDANPNALASIGTILIGGASAGMSLWRRARDLGAHLVPTYGMTEANSQVATLSPGDDRLNRGLVGAPLDGFAVTIIGHDGQPQADGVVGQITIEGPAVFSGYLGESPRPSPWPTNDLGRLSERGDLYIEGRVDDVIVSGGENVSLGRVAEIINGLVGIDDVCVVGIEDAEWGTVGGAMVVSGHGLTSIRTIVGRELKAHERPKRWLQRGVIPKLANGKHDLAAVRAAFEAEPWS